MDLFKDAAKNINLYEVKAYVRKAQNVAMNLTEMESKVREATNNEPWGASSTLMAQISAGTYNYRERQEILNFIFRRFTEKAANEWRQIYKSLQLLEYLIKHGSMSMVEEVQNNKSLIQMLKSFHYIDSKGRDQGVNVRNKSKTLLALLNDDALIRSEQKKARQNAKKFGGMASSAYGGATPSASSSAAYDDEEFANRVFGDGGVYGERFGDSAAEFRNGSTGQNNAAYEEYDETTTSKPQRKSQRSRPTASTSTVTATAPKPAENDLLGDLLSFDGPSTSNITASGPATTNTAGNDDDDDDDDDDFDDFQAAPSSPSTGNITSNLSNLYVSTPQTSQTTQPSYSSQPNSSISFGATGGGSSKTASSNDAFSSLFSTAKSKTTPISGSAKPTATKTTTTTLNDDFFSSSSAPTASKPASTSASNTNGTATGEIDLLSF
ncbi:Epsin-3, clathrin recruitment and traffic between the Golgi and endosome [Scheffersomyces spartinae]|uniref:Epsin-3, clathrin recruitment and traffic between the Golgi and endosome n=1 Tax=Scheffersomyces spartinae TaxID=45513 RepID=A0A9P7VCZ9_9ASCO|nr:Epsin-3, clathrin recruitment and traffic between the Golgi and endosome [Scheffersomyces spartinae]KAG7195820.1 Epsin-3, clathrin recruitment and traffic between the Golgi and endosome [Scheffersomyces spartinae]